MIRLRLFLVTALFAVTTLAWGQGPLRDAAGAHEGVVITFGTYPTKWEIPKPTPTPSGGDALFSFLDTSTSPDSVLKGKPKFVSDAPVCGILRAMGSYASIQGMAFAFDESKGTGKGYDTLYLDVDGTEDLSKSVGHVGIQNPKSPGVIFFESVGVIPVSKIYPGSANGNSFTLDVSLMLNDGKPFVVQGLLRGGYSGEIDTNQGKFPFKLIDNGNMRYDDKASLLDPDDEEEGDSIAVDWSGEGDFAYERARQYSLSGAANLGGRLYQLRCDADGTKVDVSEYTGPTARIGLKAVKVGTAWNGDNCLTVVGKNASYEVPVGGTPVLVPEGTYRIGTSFVSHIEKTHSWMISYSQSKPFSVAKGETRIVPFGGALTMSIAPGKEKVIVGRGDELSIPFAFSTSAGGTVDSIANMGQRGDTVPLVKIKNAAGKVVLSGKAEFG